MEDGGTLRHRHVNHSRSGGPGWCHRCCPNTTPVHARRFFNRAVPTKPIGELDTYRVGVTVSWRQTFEGPILTGQIWDKHPNPNTWWVVSEGVYWLVKEEDMFNFRSCKETIQLKESGLV